MTTFAWHVHHTILLESLTEPMSDRVAYIRDNKPAHEVDIRLALMKKVKGPLPSTLQKAYAAWQKARAAWLKADPARQKALVAWQKARAAWQKAIDDSMPAIDALHAKECPDCPWTLGGQHTIFPVAQL